MGDFSTQTSRDAALADGMRCFGINQPATRRPPGAEGAVLVPLEALVASAAQRAAGAAPVRVTARPMEHPRSRLGVFYASVFESTQ